MKGYAYYSAFTNLAQTIQQDAACGYVRSGDATAAGYSLAKASREAKGCMDEFLISARQYLAMTGDRNCRVIPLEQGYREWDNGFHARRTGEHVYVTEVTGETELKPGDEIYAVGNQTLEELRKSLGHNIFYENTDERENWDQFFRMFQTAVVFPGDGSGKKIALKHFPVSDRTPELSFRMPKADTVLMKIESFADPDRLAALMAEAAPSLAGAAKLILDLRHCEADGEPIHFLPLLPYLIDHDVSGEELFPTRTICTSYTRQNVERLVHRLRELESECTDPEARAYAEEAIAHAQEMGDRVTALRRTERMLYERRKFNEIEETEESGLENLPIAAASDAPKQVILLTDTDTCYAGEWLVQAVKGMNKVTVLGRPTAGMLDYTDLIYMDYEDIEVRFIYPMSRTKEAKEGRGVAFKGVEPDIYIPFTREECTNDRILARALEL